MMREPDWDAVYASARWLDFKVRNPDLDFRIRNFLFLTDFTNRLLIEFLNVFNSEYTRHTQRFEERCKENFFTIDLGNTLLDVLYCLGCPHVTTCNHDNLEKLTKSYRPIVSLLEKVRKSWEEKDIARRVFECLTELYGEYGGEHPYSPHNVLQFKNALVRITNVFHQLLGQKFLPVPPAVTPHKNRKKNTSSSTQDQTNGNNEPPEQEENYELAEKDRKPSDHDLTIITHDEQPEPSNIIVASNNNEVSTDNIIQRISEPLRTRVNSYDLSELLALPAAKCRFRQADHALRIFGDTATIIEAIWNDTYKQEVENHRSGVNGNINIIAVRYVCKRICDLDIWDMYDIDESLLAEWLNEYDARHLSQAVLSK